MSTNNVMCSGSPTIEGTSTGQTVATVVPRIIAIAESFKRRKEDRPEAAKLDALVAPWFDAACSAYLTAKDIKADELAEKMGVDEHYLSHMRSGRKPVALRHLIPLLDCREAVTAFVAPPIAEVGLEVSPRRVLTRDQLLESALIYVLESGPLLRSFAREVAQKHGVQPDDVLKALGEK